MQKIGIAGRFRYAYCVTLSQNYNPQTYTEHIKACFGNRV